ncbi:hypothetical protein GSI_04145 [Ganoderma sinense ZZ0214-1]|uniref:Uncharacterized protein n=1 Tax=Ganoderma sinense ZZ0214-1 TaxID=1077348 RepID=A0A2G8SID5_9APHY|nr:hypothetical protein GSI_04145 [Ganoderma sinense ZZ0214-1]
MSIITSFFVSIDSMVYAFPYRDPDLSAWTVLDLLISASLGGAIILHVCACKHFFRRISRAPSNSLTLAILAYVASFVLIRYQLSDAEKAEQATERPSTVSGSSKPEGHTRLQSFSAESTLSPWEAYTDLRALVSVYQVRFLSIISCGVVPRQARAKRNRDPEKSVADDPVLKLKSMVTTLSRCHTVVTIMTQLGFMLALLGILAYFWTGLPRALGIFASALLGTCLLAIGAVIM